MESIEVQERGGTPDNFEEPPVLPPDSPLSGTPPAEDTDNQATAAEPNASEKDKKEKVVPPTVPGLSEMLNEWQISGTPEERQFFSVQVV